MFQSSKKRLATLLDIVDDMLVGTPEAEPVAPHPHRRPVQLRTQRRAGEVMPRPMHCLCPVRPTASPARDAVRKP